MWHCVRTRLVWPSVLLACVAFRLPRAATASLPVPAASPPVGWSWLPFPPLRTSCFVFFFVLIVSHVSLLLLSCACVFPCSCHRLLFTSSLYLVIFPLFRLLLLMVLYFFVLRFFLFVERTDFSMNLHFFRFPWGHPSCGLLFRCRRLVSASSLLSFWVGF